MVLGSVTSVYLLSPWKFRAPCGGILAFLSLVPSSLPGSQSPGEPGPLTEVLSFVTGGYLNVLKWEWLKTPGWVERKAIDRDRRKSVLRARENQCDCKEMQNRVTEPSTVPSSPHYYQTSDFALNFHKQFS